ncbi:BamA/TamA family outer membrane protein [Croceimicrobium hydrocarbonivorans]|nr:BamA/TamA family outer membrane protein [Croceimicrobium hydrocarbonivorans]
MKAQNFWSRYWESLTKEESNDGSPSFIVYPTLAFAPETSWEFGLSSLYLYYAKGNPENRLSEFNAFTFYTLEHQYGLWLDHANYGDHDRYMFLGRLRYQSFPLFYHGVGKNTPADPLALVDAQYLLWKEHFLKQIQGYLYAGVYADLQSLSRSNFISQSDQGYPFPSGANGSFNLGLGLSAVYDDRHNVLNVRDGNFTELSFLRYSPFWGSEYNFTSLLVDSRFYRSTTSNQVWANQLLGQFVNGNAPFHMLSLMGGESMMRGYYYGRYRDQNLLAFQSEYRILPFSFSKRWGASFFMAAGQVYPQWENLKLNDFKLAGGAGLRFLIFPQKDIYTRLDFAMTEEGPGFYFFIGEAF